MKSIPQQVSKSVRARNPHIYPESYSILSSAVDKKPKRIRQNTKPLLNITEQRYCDTLESRGHGPVFKQAFTLRLDPPFRSYKPDLAYFGDKGFISLTFVEVKGPHRFRKAGIAKAALAAKTYPQFRFELADWDGKQFKESVLSS